jgi:hypothetical protein
MSLFFKGTHACAIDREVYLHAEDAKRLSAAVCRHEVLHLFQYGRAGGFSAFLGQYFAFTLYDLMATRSAAEAYKRNPFECEALSYEDLKTWRANASKQWIYY